MNPTFRKVALIAAVLGFGVSVLVAACGDDEDEAPAATTTTAATTTEPPPPTAEPPVTVPPPTTTEIVTRTTSADDGAETIRIAVEGGRPVGGIARPSVDVGDEVTILVSSDVVDHIHLHGYDLTADAGPGSTARIEFTADVPGRFEIELEERGVQIADLAVEP
jgi:hypothetical protein